MISNLGQNDVIENIYMGRCYRKCCELAVSPGQIDSLLNKRYAHMKSSIQGNTRWAGYTGPRDLRKELIPETRSLLFKPPASSYPGSFGFVSCFRIPSCPEPSQSVSPVEYSCHHRTFLLGPERVISSAREHHIKISRPLPGSSILLVVIQSSVHPTEDPGG